MGAGPDGLSPLTCHAGTPCPGCCSGTTWHARSRTTRSASLAFLCFIPEYRYIIAFAGCPTILQQASCGWELIRWRTCCFGWVMILAPSQHLVRACYTRL